MTEPPQQPEDAQSPEPPAPPPPYPAYPAPPAAPQAPPPPYGQTPYGQTPYGQTPYGQTPYPQPAYGQPPYPPTGQNPYGAPKSGTNGFAIAALVFGIIGGCLAIPFGITALVQTSRSGQKGRGMAIAGLVLAGLWIVLLIVLAVVGAANDADRDTHGKITHGGRVTVQNVHVGDCITELTQGTTHSVKGVPCSTPHQAEVYAALTFDGSDFPGSDKLIADAETRCTAQLKALHLPVASLRGLNIYFFRPTESAWTTGDRHLTCMVFSDTERTGSFKGS